MSEEQETGQETPSEQTSEQQVDTSQGGDGGALGLGGEAAQQADHAPDGALGLSEDVTQAEWVDQTMDDLRGYLPQTVSINGQEVEYAKHIGDEALQSTLDFVNGQQVDAKAFLDFQIQQQVAAEESRAAQAAAWNAEMQQQLMQHPTIGGANWDGTKARVVGLLDRFGDTELKQFLAQSGGQNYAPVVAFLNRVAQALPSKGGPAGGQTVQLREVALHDKLFNTGS